MGDVQDVDIIPFPTPKKKGYVDEDPLSLGSFDPFNVMASEHVNTDWMIFDPSHIS